MRSDTLDQSIGSEVADQCDKCADASFFQLILKPSFKT